MKHLYAALLCLSCFCLPATAQVDCSNERYKEKVFDNYEVIDNVIYARKQTSSGVWQDLGYDVYLPAGDTETLRPAVMLAHGGAYIDFIDQKSPDIVRLARDLVQRGYVVFSVEYREEASALALFNVESMIKAVGRSLIDIRDATCYLMDTTILHGNPYGVDPDQVFVGGVSAGAVSFLQAVFLDSLSWLPQQYQDWILEVEPNTQALLDNKYCGATVIGIINISGAVLDTAWIKEYKKDEYPAIYSIHGGQDPIVPFLNDYPFGLTSLPRLMGTGLIHDRANTLGIRSDLDFYPNQGHVPIIGFNLEALLNGNPGDLLFNPYILNRTLENMSEFCYSLLNCDASVPTAVVDGENAGVVLYPNPNRGSLHLKFTDSQSRPAAMQLVNGIGQVVKQELIPPGLSAHQVRHDLPPGFYQAVFYDAGNVRIGTASLMVQH